MAQAVKIRINDVTKAFRVKGQTALALQGVDVEIYEEEIVCLLGPSGCGKSTLLNVIAGFQMPTSGSVTVGDRPVTGPGPDRGVVFQSPALFPWLTVRDNITFGPKRRGVPRAEYLRAADEYIAAIGLEGFEGHFPYQLSGGMAQRVAIARALIGRPDVLLLDEPFGALDAQTRLTMQELLLGIWARFHPTIVFVTHDVEEAIFIASRVLLMSPRPGRIREEIVVPVPRPRTIDVLTGDEFVARKKHLLALIHEQPATGGG